MNVGRMAEWRGTDLDRMTLRSEAPNVWQSVPDAALALARSSSLIYALFLFFKRNFGKSSYTMHASSPDRCQHSLLLVFLHP